jgi:hypothetical protein
LQLLPVATCCHLFFTDCFLQHYFAGGGDTFDGADDMDDEDNLELGGDISDEEEVTTNESGLEAIEIQKAAHTIELSAISAEDLWAMLQNKKMKGGIMARTLFIAAKALEPQICEPWIGDKKLLTRKQEVIDQRKLFLDWASATRVIDWIRLEIFKIVLQKPHTYKTFNVTHANGPKVLRSSDGKDLLQALQASNSAMARVAHLACHPDSRVILNILFGSKKIEVIDAPDLQPDVLWQDLANVYVNNPHWEIRQCNVLQLQNHKDPAYLSSPIDVSQVSPIGLTAETVRLVFTDVKQMFGALANSIHGRTGCNSPIGEELYGKAWTNFINGGLMFFARKEVAMYTFKLWSECEALPKYCLKELTKEAQVRIGMLTGQKFNLPCTPKTSTTRGSSASQLATPPTPSTDSTAQSMETVASFLSFKMAQMQKEDAEVAARASSIAPKLPQVSTCVDGCVFVYWCLQ